MEVIKRLFELNLPPGQSAFLWGPRKVGKSFWLTHHLKNITLIDLLKTDVYAEYITRPHLLRERYQNHKKLICIDEIQKIPALLDEIHWLIENKGISFLLTGSSARKLKRGQANLLGGRAWRRTMTPLSCLEIDNFDLDKAMISGLLPPHYLSKNPIESLRAYIADYLKEEIAAEALVQNIPSFNEFLRVAALTSSELINYVNIARETGVPHKVVRKYFEILEDTYLGFRIPPWKKSNNRRMITTEKFYLFDTGVTNYLARRQPQPGSSEFGKSFEQFILMELRTYQAYKNPELPITYWRTSTGQEVDFLLGDREIAIEIKGSKKVHEHDTRSLKALMQDGPIKKAFIVCLENEPRTLSNNITVIPWKQFIELLWSNTLIN
ncbi:MAG: putative AAA+ superfamily ATPase [Candidatus Omnitrophota bacterium]|jgi:predicted AAA+ superfamily ATPase